MQNAYFSHTEENLIVAWVFFFFCVLYNEGKEKNAGGEKNAGTTNHWRSESTKSGSA